MRPLLASVALLACVAGCSSSSTRTVSGQLSLTQLHPVNAQVVAISSAGRVFRAPIAANGSFSISLPTNATYTMRFANATTAANRYDAFATLAPRTPSGSTHWFTLTSGGTIRLGLVSRVGTTAKATAGLQTQSDGSDSEGSDGAEAGEQEDDGAEACDLSGGSDDADVDSDHDLNDDVDSDHDGTPDAADTHDDRATCASKGDDDCSLDGDEEKELDDDANQSCSGGGGGATDGGPAIGSPAPVPGLI